MKKFNSCCSDQHPNHSDQIPKLNRISGQVEGIKKMISANKYCPDILIQLKAVRSAIKSVEINILKKHMSSCLMNAAHISEKESAKKIDEILKIFKKFDK